MELNLPDLLLPSALFKDISRPELSVMLKCLQPKVNTFTKNSYIGIQGQPLPGLGILLSGKAAVIKETAAGSRTVLTLLGPGDIFGEMMAFARPQRWPASVLAQSSCQTLFLPPDNITSQCSLNCPGHSQLLKNLLSLLAGKALLLNRKVEYLSISGMRGKISTYLLEQQQLFGSLLFTLPLNRNELADFLNVSRTALSRELGRMRDEGLIEFYKSSVKILDLNGLQQAAL